MVNLLAVKKRRHAAPVRETPLPSRHLTHTERFDLYKRLVDFVNKKKDRECALLGAMGFSTGYIAAKTKLSPGQVGYRLGKAGIFRADFRNGSSEFAKLVLRQSRPVVDAQLEAHLVKHVPNLYESGAYLNGSNGNGRH
jgi:hypothetical protein